MQSAKDFLQAEVDKKLAEASAIIETAQKAARTLVPDERSRVEQLTSEVTQLKGRVQELDDNEKLAGELEKMRGPVNQPAEVIDSTKGSLGETFIKSDAYNALLTGFKSGQMTGQWTSGAVELPEFDTKATVTTTASPIIQPNVQGGIQELRLRRLTIADLLATGTTDGGVVRYVREATNVNAAAGVNEGDLKPESTITFDTVDEPVRKIATFLPISDEMLEDASQLRSYLDGRLRLFVQHEEERQLLSGTGTAPQLRGILNRTGIQTVAKGAGASVLDALYTAITNIRVNSLVEPDGIVMHPTNYAAIRTQKDGQGQYYGGGPFTGAYGNSGGLAPDNVWGLPVVVTPAIAVNTALVGAFASQAQMFRRGGLTVEASNSHADFFQRNFTAIRAEERLALAVYRPAAFHTITALNA
jgi:HK97 family phage major capsid protein